MPRIDFYVLPIADPHARRITACKLIEKAYRQGRTVYLQTDSEEDTRMFDDLLWTFRQGSFVPHERVDATSPDAPVLLGHQSPPESIADVLVNMSANVPLGFERFTRIAELIDQNDATRLDGRQRYKQYQDAGYEIETHHLE